MEHNASAANSLLSAYIRCGRLGDVRRWFYEIEKMDVSSWTNTIGGYAQQSHAKDAIEVFNHLRQEGVQPVATS